MSRYCHAKVPLIGRMMSAMIDRSMLSLYGIDLHSPAIDVKHLSIAHPSGVLFGGVGIYSPGRVVVMAGVKFGGNRPSDPEFQRLAKEKRVFQLGDNVVISTGAILIGPLTICDNVLIAPGSLVNKSITEPGVYMGYPARRISNDVTEEFVAHLPQPEVQGSLT